MGYQSYKDLKIYQQAKMLAIKVHEMTMRLPKFEMYEEGSQVRRSSKSVVSNIVEGFGRRAYKQEFIRFLIFAHSSCNETKEHIEILFATKSLPDTNLYGELLEGYDELGKMIGGFIKSVENTHLS